MRRAAFLKRMAFAALACGFIDVPEVVVESEAETLTLAAIDGLITALPESPAHATWRMHSDMLYRPVRDGDVVALRPGQSFPPFNP